MCRVAADRSTLGRHLSCPLVSRPPSLHPWMFCRSALATPPLRTPGEVSPTIATGSRSCWAAVLYYHTPWWPPCPGCTAPPAAAA